MSYQIFAGAPYCKPCALCSPVAGATKKRVPSWSLSQVCSSSPFNPLGLDTGKFHEDVARRSPKCTSYSKFTICGLHSLQPAHSMTTHSFETSTLQLSQEPLAHLKQNPRVGVSRLSANFRRPFAARLASDWQAALEAIKQPHSLLAESFCWSEYECLLVVIICTPSTTRFRTPDIR